MPGPVVRDLMTPKPKTLGRNDVLSIADQVMEMDRIRHLPVLDEAGKLAGILSQRDLYFNALVRALGYGSFAKEKMLGGLRVKECMTEDVRVIAPGAAVSEAAALLVEHKIGCLPVVENGRLVGILTETDVVASLAG